MKLSVSLPDDDVAYLDRYAREHGLGSRSAALRAALAMLRAEELGPAYQDAWHTWAADDADAWEAAAGDGLHDD